MLLEEPKKAIIICQHFIIWNMFCVFVLFVTLKRRCVNLIIKTAIRSLECQNGCHPTANVTSHQKALGTTLKRVNIAFIIPLSTLSKHFRLKLSLNLFDTIRACSTQIMYNQYHDFSLYVLEIWQQWKTL